MSDFGQKMSNFMNFSYCTALHFFGIKTASTANVSTSYPGEHPQTPCLYGCMKLFLNSQHCFFKGFTFQFAFPDSNYIPAHSFKFTDMLLIPLNVPGELRLPEVNIGLRHGGVFASMPVKEASVNKYDAFVFWKNYIRLTGKFSVVFPISVAMREQPGPSLLFGRSFSAPDAGHIPTAFLRR